MRTANEGLGDGVMTQISCMLWTIFCWFGSLTLIVQVGLTVHREEIPRTEPPTNKKEMTLMRLSSVVENRAMKSKVDGFLVTRAGNLGTYYYLGKVK